MKNVFVCGAIYFLATTAFAAGSAPVTVTNGPGNPVPVTGSVTIKGDVAGGLQSVDENVTLFDDFIEVTDAFFGNHTLPLINVKPYKEVRVVVQRGSCTGCGDPITAAIYAGSVQMDSIVVNQANEGAMFASRTYTVPGVTMFITLKAGVAGTTNTVHVLVFGRAN